MKSRTTYLLLGIIFVLASFATLSSLSKENITVTPPLATTTVATSTTASTTANGMQVYRNEQYKFMFEYATNTKIQEEVNESKIYYDYFLTSVDVSGNKERIVGISPNISAIEDRMHQLMGEPSVRRIFTLQPDQKATRKALGNEYGTIEIQVTGATLVNAYGVPEVQVTASGKKICELFTVDPSKSYYLVMDCRYKSILDSLTFF